MTLTLYLPKRLTQITFFNPDVVLSLSNLLGQLSNDFDLLFGSFFLSDQFILKPLVFFQVIAHSAVKGIGNHYCH